VAGRIWELVFAAKMAPVNLARVAVHVLPVSFVVLIAAALADASYAFAIALAFTLLLGVSNGLITIVRGGFPLAVFGPKGYGEVLGILATPYLILNALAPAVFALVVEWGGWRLGVWMLMGASVLAAISMEVMARWYNRRQQRSVQR